MNVIISQNNFLVGNLPYNYDIIKDRYSKACTQGCDLIVFSELAICGYPVDDLLHKEYFIAQISDWVNKITDLTYNKKCAILIGSPLKKSENLYNGACLIKNGEIKQEFFKKELPNYKLFDEKRYFKPSNGVDYFELSGYKFSVLICEDLWNVENIDQVKSHQSDAILALNASPFSPDKLQQRIDVCSKFCKALQIPLLYVNQIGGVDSFVFDGNSFTMNDKGEIVDKLLAFEEDSKIFNIEELSSYEEFALKEDNLADLYNGAVLALRDYVTKTGFSKVLLGMSGGIDSALVACLAVDALGSQNVRLIALPTKFNSQESYRDAINCAKNLGINLEEVPIQNIVDSSLQSLDLHFSGLKKDTAEENVQSRIRGMILMAISNKFNELLIATGNKSEIATGYTTIYGDMNGAFNPIKDLYKTQIFALAQWRNENIASISIYNRKNLIPDNIINKAPSAELAFDQKDSDSLPSYEILDQILYKMIEEEKSIVKIIEETGFEENLVKKIAKLFYQNEYKRKQAAPGPKLSKMSFDRDRRYLITNNFWQ